MNTSRHLLRILSITSLALAISCAGTEFSGGEPESERNSDYDQLSRLAKVFNIQSKDSGSFSLDDGRLTQDVKLVRELKDQSDLFHQVERPLMTINTKQGSSSRQFKDIRHQTKDGGVLDLLIVIDDSGSMGDEQSHIKANLPSLISSVDQADWRIAVVSTDSNKPCNRGIVNKSDSDREGKFKAIIEGIGLNGSAYETGMYMAQQGLTCANPQSWLRPGSSVAVLFVTDEQNCGNERNCLGKPSTAQHLTNVVTSLGRTVGRDFRAYGLISNGDIDYKPFIEGPAKGISVAIQTITSLPAAQQSAKYQEVLSRISRDLQDLLEPDFTLSAVPRLDASLKVKVDGVMQTLGLDFTVTDNILSFKLDRLPDPNSEIVIEYVSVDNRKKDYDLGAIPAAKTLSVEVSGTAVLESTYTVEGKILKFKNYPPELAPIKIVFRDDAVKLNSAFHLKEGVVQSTVVLKNGTKEDKNFTIKKDATDDYYVEYLNPTSDNADIVLEYKLDVGPQLKYAVVISGDNVSDFELQDSVSKENLAVDLASGVLTIPAEKFVEGRVLELSYSTDQSMAEEFKLPFEIDLSSVEISPAIPNCEVGKEIISIAGMLKLNCDRIPRQAYSIKFKSPVLYASEFEIPDAKKPDIGSWEVKLDGKVVKFKREGKKIIILSPIPAGAKQVLVSYDPFT